MGQAKTYLHSKAKAYGFSDFARAVRGAIRAYWSGTTDEMEFYEMMGSALYIGLTAAWQEGARGCGVAPDELTLDELKQLRFRVANQMNQLLDFERAIAAGSKANKGKLTPLLRRGEMWINRYNDVRNQAAQLACRDRKLEWIFGDTVHCTDCANLNGRVYRASTWEKYGLRPQLHSLQCRGFRCQCRLVPTDKPATRGRPPRLVGAR